METRPAGVDFGGPFHSPAELRCSANFKRAASGRPVCSTGAPAVAQDALELGALCEPSVCSWVLLGAPDELRDPPMTAGPYGEYVVTFRRHLRLLQWALMRLQ